MEVLGLALVICTILFLVDKNGQWNKFWHVVSIGGITIALLVTIFALSFYVYEKHEAAKIESQAPIDLSGGFVLKENNSSTHPISKR